MEIASFIAIAIGVLGFSLSVLSSWLSIRSQHKVIIELKKAIKADEIKLKILLQPISIDNLSDMSEAEADSIISIFASDREETTNGKIRSRS